MGQNVVCLDRLTGRLEANFAFYSPLLWECRQHEKTVNKSERYCMFRVMLVAVQYRSQQRIEPSLGIWFAVDASIRRKPQHMHCDEHAH